MGFLSCFSPLRPALAASSTASSIAHPLLFDKASLDEKHAVLEHERPDDGKAAEKLKLLRQEMSKVGVDA